MNLEILFMVFDLIPTTFLTLLLGNSQFDPQEELIRIMHAEDSVEEVKSHFL